MRSHVPAQSAAPSWLEAAGCDLSTKDGMAWPPCALVHYFPPGLGMGKLHLVFKRILVSTMPLFFTNVIVSTRISNSVT